MRTWYSAIILAMKDIGSRNVQLQDIYSVIDRYRPLSEHDREPHPKYPQETYKHTVRAYLKVLQRHGLVDHVGRAAYSLTPTSIKHLDAFSKDMYGRSSSRSGKIVALDIIELLSRLGLKKEAID